MLDHAQDPQTITGRSLDHLEADKNAARRIAQMAVNVELFTIPLYMTSLYSLQGMHEINSSDNQFYKGRQWPGMATTAEPGSANERAFNTIFSVFIQEMLHLQLASNVALAIGVTPDYTKSALFGDHNNWTCYGPDKHMIPGIVDLRDTTTYENIPVNLGPLDETTIDLFLAIEESHETASTNLKPVFRKPDGKYFPTVPFRNWTKTSTELPLFGTIRAMYQAYYDYLHLTYQDGSKLFDHMYVGGDKLSQGDLFNKRSSTHMAEFPDIHLTIPKGTSAADALPMVLDMMNAITDQGEGSQLKSRTAGAGALGDVLQPYQPDAEALNSNYPSFNADSQPTPSADAAARVDNGGQDHYERFLEIKTKLLKDIETWKDWHDAGHRWSAKDLISNEHDNADNPHPLPTADRIADALNEMKDKAGVYKPLISKAASGAIYGITSKLEAFFQQGKAFPYPSMVGSGDRMAIFWAVFGEAPDLSLPLDELDTSSHLYHACQGLALDPSAAITGLDGLPVVDVFHTCKGSNACRTQGGCGFVHDADQSGGGGCGGSCSHVALSQNDPEYAGNLCGAPTPPKDNGPYSAPGDNKCSSFGGCAVPISASQMLPKDGQMKLFAFEKGQDGYHSTALDKDDWLTFSKGELVYDVAWKAYQTAAKAMGQTPPESPPEPSIVRLAFPPST